MSEDKLLSSVPPFVRDIARCLYNLCFRIETLSSQCLLHPSKCRCLAQSYSVLLRHVLTLTSLLSPASSSSPFLQHKLPALLTVLLHTLHEGERFLQDCTYQAGWNSWLNFGAARRQQEWLIDKALAIALSTEIFDVHLHDFVWCISTLVGWVLLEYCTDHGGLDLSLDALLKEIWASADEEADVKCMHEVFNKMGAKGHEELWKHICHRLSESSKSTKANPWNLGGSVIPTYLLMDPPDFTLVHDHLLGSNDTSVVFKGRMKGGGSFACKQFHRLGHEQVFAMEAVLQAGLKHANTVRLLWCTPKEAAHCSQALVMELMDEDLGHAIAKRRSAGRVPPFSLLAGVDLMLQIAKGMEHLHDKRMMHWDLKSGNILIRRSPNASYLDETGHLSVKVADFGTSKVNHYTSLFTSKCVGTSIWRAPEVLDTEDESKYTFKADVYSFAIVCSEIFTGLPPCELLPYEGGRDQLCKVLKEGRRPELPCSCPPAIASYIEKCWDRDASQRPTFHEICAVFRFFKACILLGETKNLLREAEMLRRVILDFDKLHRAGPDQKQVSPFEQALCVVSEMNFFGSVRCERNRGLTKLLQDIAGSADAVEKGAKERGFTKAVGEGEDKKEDYSSAQEPEQNKLVFFHGGQLSFDLEDLLRASAEVLGKGTFGTSYKVVLEDGPTVVVKRLKKASVGWKEFEQHMDGAGKMRHRNLVPMRAYYYSKEEKLLVHEYLPLGSVAEAIHGQKDSGEPALDWQTRLKIAVGAARGLEYLHGTNSKCAHGDIKSSNILLHREFEACILDYGPAPIFWMAAKNATAIANRMAAGYRATKVAKTHKLTQKSDVYSFGVVLLELLTGKAPSQTSAEQGMDLPKWVQSVVLEDWISKVFDHELMKFNDIEEEMVQFLEIALACVSPSPDRRPTMAEVLKMIQDVRHLSDPRAADDDGRSPTTTHSSSPQEQSGHDSPAVVYTSVPTSAVKPELEMPSESPATKDVELPSPITTSTTTREAKLESSSPTNTASEANMGPFSPITTGEGFTSPTNASEAAMSSIIPTTIASTTNTDSAVAPAPKH